MGYLWLEDILGLLRVPSQRVIVTPGHETVRLGLFLVDERLLLPLTLDRGSPNEVAKQQKIIYHDAFIKKINGWSSIKETLILNFLVLV